jgi:hypothetical protein
VDDNKINLPEGSTSLYFPFPPKVGRGKNGNEWFLWKCKPAGQDGNAENVLFPSAQLHTSLLSVAGPIAQGSNGREQFQNGGFDATITRTGTGNATRYEVTAGRMESTPAPQAQSYGQPQQQPQADGAVPDDGVPSPWQLVSTYGFALKEARQLWANEGIEVTPTELHAIATSMFIQICREGAWRKVKVVVAQETPPAPQEEKLVPMPTQQPANVGDDLPF